MAAATEFLPSAAPIVSSLSRSLAAVKGRLDEFLKGAVVRRCGPLGVAPPEGDRVRRHGEHKPFGEVPPLL